MGCKRRSGDGEDLETKVRLAEMGIPVRVREREVALLRGCSVKLIQKERHLGIRVQPIKEGRSVYYSLKAILDDLRARESA